ncbi:MAG: hypothetical protein WCT04_09075 [Planctomycetota bacterium]
MNQTMTTRWMGLVALVVCVVAGTAQAATHVDVGIGFGGGYSPHYAPPVYSAPVYTAPVSSGYYETRVERVLVASERTERRWQEGRYETRYINGYAQTVCVSQPGWREYCVPAQYENRTVRVWVPTYCAPTYTYSNYYTPNYYSPNYCTPNYCAPRYSSPSFGLDLNFRSRH